jgi:hypothetical protein
VTKRYRWHALESLRRAQRVKRESEVTAARSRLAAAEDARSHAEQALHAHHANSPPSPADSSSTSALELQRSAAYSQHHRQAILALSARLADAQHEASRRQSELEHAQLALARASADKLVIERDRLRFEGERLRARDARDQTELEDQVKKAPNSARN